MEIKILKKEKDELHIELDNLTMVELLRNELWQDSAIEIAAWRREHPAKNPVLIVKTKEKSAKKALLDCISRIKKINDKLLSEFKKL
jgi:DNA-directed RNA polymerase subunit L